MARRTGPVVRRRPFLVLLGAALVVVLVLLELLLLRSYGDTERTTRDFKEATDITTAVRDVHRETFLLSQQVGDLPVRPGRSHVPPAIELRRGLVGRQLSVVEASAAHRPELRARTDAVDRTLARFDAQLAAAPGRTPELRQARLERTLAELEVQVKRIADEEEHGLYDALSHTLSEHAKSQKLVVGLGGFALIFGLAVGAAIRRAIRGDFARAYAALAAEAGERELLQEQLKHQATHDALTGLANRVEFDHVLSAAPSDRRGPDAVLYIDLDGFKRVNDTLGHDAGDALLCEVAQRLTQAVRGVDRVARLGGDEFAVLLSGVSDGRAAVETGERIREALIAPWHVHGQEVRVGASVGVALRSGDVAGASELITAADLSMYEAKHGGKGAVRLYDTAMRSRATDRALLRPSMVADLEDRAVVLPRG